MGEVAALDRAQVGQRAHRIVALAFAEGLAADRPARALQLARLGGEQFQGKLKPKRHRENLFDAVTAAGVYINRLSPSSGWVFVGAEESVADCRFDLVWSHKVHGVLVDEIKLGIGRENEDRVRKQVRRYCEVGAAHFGTDFIGVRLAAVHEPARCRMYRPNSGKSVLVADHELAQELRPR